MSGPFRPGSLRPGAALVGISSLVVLACLAAELHLFGWKLAITPDLVELREAGVYSVDLRRAPFGMPGIRFMSGDREGLRPHHLHTQAGVALYEDDVELGPPHVSLDQLAHGAGRFAHHGRVLYFTASDASDPRTSGHRYTARIPLVADRPLTVACLVTWLLCLAGARFDDASRLRRLSCRVRAGLRGPAAEAFLSRRGDELGVFVFSILAALAYTLANSSLSIPHGPLVAGVAIQDGRMWDDAALVLASGSGYDMAHRPGYPLLLGAGYALFGVSKLLPLILNLLAFGGTSLLVYKAARALFDRSTALAAVLLLHTDVLRLGYLQVSNTDSVGCFLTAAFVYMGFALLCGRDRPLLLWLVLGLLLGLANLVKTMTLPAVAVVAACVAVSGRIRGAPRKLLVISLVVAGLLAPLVPWNAYRQRTQGAAELTEKGANALFLATSPEINVDGNVHRARSRQLRDRDVGSDELAGSIARNLTGHWTAYLRNVLLATHKSFDTLHFGGHGSFPALCVGFLLMLAARWNVCPTRRGAWILGSGAAFAAITWSLFGLGIWLPVAIVCVASVPRRDLGVFLALAAAPLLVTSLLGMGGYDRQLIAVTWSYPIVTAGSLAVIMDRLAAALARSDGAAGAENATSEAPRRAATELDWSSLGIVAALVLLTAVGSLRIAAGAPNDGLLATQFSMFGKQLWALPTSEFERRGSGGGGEENLACEPEREAELLREARRLIQSVPREPGPRRRLVCFRAYTGRHLYRIREGQRGIWHRLRPFFFDRLYARTLLRDSSFIRFGGLLEDSWHGRVVHVVGSMGANDVFNAVILEDAAPATGGAATRERARVTDPRHLRATRNGI